MVSLRVLRFVFPMAALLLATNGLAQEPISYSQSEARRMRAAIESNDVFALERLIPDSAHANGAINGVPILHIALHAGNLEALRFLFNRGADPNAELRKGDCTLPLVLIAVQYPDVARAFIEAGADIEATNSAGTNWPLMAAVVQHEYELARYLVERGARLNRKSSIGRKTVLHFVGIRGWVDFYEYLALHGADETLLDGSNWTARQHLDVSLQRQSREGSHDYD